MKISSFLLALLMTSFVLAQPDGYNYDELKIPKFDLPDPLTLVDGSRVTDSTAWQEVRRRQILELFETHVYGRAPTDVSGVWFGEPEVTQQSLDGVAIRKQVKIHFSREDNSPTADLLIYLPSDKQGPVPVFVGLNFDGNHTISADPGIWLTTSWVRNHRVSLAVDNRAQEAGRGRKSWRWPIEEIVARGYAVATIYYGDIDPDVDDGFQNGVHPLFYEQNQQEPTGDQWGSIAAWAWGLSRALDYFETDNDIDHTRTAVLGHSRLGKTALWAGARDERFAMVISNDSGCGGAALSRRRFGETVKRINTAFPHWFCKNFHKFNDNETALPVDQHMLMALIAPRPLYVASAERDLWADPRGEFLSLKFATPVYDLFGKESISNLRMPRLNQPIMRDVGYHIRTGKHDITLYDWQQYLDFADRHFGRQD